MTHRDQWRKLAQLRLREAQALLSAGHPSGAYYLAGYSLECALKAVIATHFKSNTIPPRQLVLDTYQHGLEKLVAVAGLGPARRARAAIDPTFDVNWAVAKDWSETARYETWQEAEARDLLHAISQREHGVLRWVRSNW